MNVREAIAAAAGRFASEGDLAGTASRDAEWLLLHLLALSKASLLAHPERELTKAESDAYERRVRRRLLHEPVQYITGEQEFYGLTLRVTPDVLIPRPETELLVEVVLARLPEDRPLRVLDVGTGSGAIALALAAHLPLAMVTAVDVSAAALRVAEGNARAHGLDSRIRFRQSDLFGGVQGERFDAVVSNPPYVPERERASLHPQVREHEPSLALFGGAGGLDSYRRLVPGAFEALLPGGLLAMEIGFGQRAALAEFLAGWKEISFVDDLQGIPRVVLARRPLAVPSGQLH